MSGNEWQNVFCGREEELQFLKDKWHKVANSEKPEPQFVNLVADSGLGKTRLVQEFYSWLVKEFDNTGYWPEKLGSDVENLRVNPEFNANNERPVMPFVWWGVRFKKPQSRNQNFGSALPNYLPALVPHFYEFYAERERVSGILKAGGLAINMASLGSIQLVQSTLEFASLGFSALALARDKFLSKKTVEKVKNVRNAQKGYMEDQVEVLYQDFHTMMSAPLDLKTNIKGLSNVIKGKADIESVMATMSAVPAIIFLDDTQWIDDDALLLIRKLVEDAKSNAWPLMIVTTHWESEWKKQKSDKDKGTQFVELAKLNSAAVRFLDKTKGLDLMLRTAFPQLSSSQEKTIIVRVDGNPGYMEAIIRDLRDEPEYFVEENFNYALTKKGEEYIRSQECDFFNITEKRFKKLPLELRKALRWATYQGVFFSEKVGSIVYKVMSSSYNSISFEDADSPFCFISRDGHSISEFRQRIFYEVANKKLSYDDEELASLRRAVQEAIIVWIRDSDFTEVDASELAFVTGLAVSHFDSISGVYEPDLLKLLSIAFENYYETKQVRSSTEIANLIWEGIEGCSLIAFEDISLKVQINSLLLAALEPEEVVEYLFKLKEMLEVETSENDSNRSLQKAWVLSAVARIYLKQEEVRKASKVLSEVVSHLGAINKKLAKVDSKVRSLNDQGICYQFSSEDYEGSSCIWAHMADLRSLLKALTGYKRIINFQLHSEGDFCYFFASEKETIGSSEEVRTLLLEYIEGLSLLVPEEHEVYQVLEFMLSEGEDMFSQITSSEETMEIIDDYAIRGLNDFLLKVGDVINKKFYDLSSYAQNIDSSISTFLNQLQDEATYGARCEFESMYDYETEALQLNIGFSRSFLQERGETVGSLLLVAEMVNSLRLYALQLTDSPSEEFIKAEVKKNEDELGELWGKVRGKTKKKFSYNWWLKLLGAKDERKRYKYFRVKPVYNEFNNYLKSLSTEEENSKVYIDSDAAPF